MKNTTVLEMINDGKIEELKALLRDEIYKDSLKGSGDAKKRYTAMKKYFTYHMPSVEKFQKPCVVEYNGEKYTAFMNGYSLVLTTEDTGEIDVNTDSSNYMDPSKVISFKGDKEMIDVPKVIADAKSNGYKLTKSAVEPKKDDAPAYLMYYNNNYYRIGLLDATYSIIDDGEPAEVFSTGHKNAGITIKNSKGMCFILPVKCTDNYIGQSYVTVINA